MLFKGAGGFVVLGILALAGYGIAQWSGETSAEELGKQALGASDAKGRQLAALELAGRGESARDEMREVFKTSEDPGVRAALLDGLASVRDWDSMPDMIAALEDADPQVRGRAAAACQTMFGIHLNVRADDPPARRRQVVQHVQQLYEIHLHPPVVEEVGE